MPLNARDGGLSRDVANVTSVVCSRFSPVPGIKGFFQWKAPTAGGRRQQSHS